MDIAIFGLGYVGLTSALMFCEKGHQVLGLELVSQKKDILSRGELHLYEDGLKELLEKHWGAKRFSIAENLPDKKKFVAVLTVGTPSNKSGVIDLSQVDGVLSSLSESLNKNEGCEVLIILRSTIPVGSCEEKFIPFLEKNISKKVSWDFAFYPEFLREGSALSDFESTESALISISRPDVLERWKDFFSPIPGFTTPLISSFKVAEMTKLAFNSFNALRISYSNELYSIAGAHGVDLDELKKVQKSYLKSQKADYLQPGFSFGGHCLSKDLGGLIQLGREKKIESQLLKSIHESNEDHYLRYLDFIESYRPKNILISGITFKPDTDDSRGSFSLRLIRDLLETPQYKDQRKVYIWEGDLAFEKALPQLKGLNIERVNLESINELALDSLILGPRKLEGKLKDDLFNKCANLFDLMYHSYKDEGVLNPFKDTHVD